MTIHVIPALMKDAPRVAALLRAEDRAEAEATGHAAIDVLRVSIAQSAEAWLAHEDGGEPIAAWGLVHGSVLQDEVATWLLTCRAVERHKRAFVQISRVFLQRWQEHGYVLSGLVDARYARCLRWLHREGFAFAAPVLFGPARVPFLPYRRG